MKKLFLTLVVALGVNSAFAFSSIDEPKAASAQANKEITQLLNSVYLDGFLEKEELAKVIFIVNDLNQIVVLQVKSDNKDVQEYITNALNYKQLSSKELTAGKNYGFVVNFKLVQ